MTRLAQAGQDHLLAAVALGLLELVNFPLGTLVGALAIWYLLGEGKQAFA